MSGIGGPANSNSGVGYSTEFTQEPMQHRIAPDEAPTQVNTTRQHADERYVASQALFPEDTPTEDPPAFNNPGNSILLDFTPRRGQQAAACQARAAIPQPPAFGEHINTPTEDPANDPALRPRPSTSSFRRLMSRQPSQGTLRSQTSTASFQSSAFGSRPDLTGPARFGDLPPVPPLHLPRDVGQPHPRAESRLFLMKRRQRIRTTPPRVHRLVRGPHRHRQVQEVQGHVYAIYFQAGGQKIPKALPTITCVTWQKRVMPMV